MLVLAMIWAVSPLASPHEPAGEAIGGRAAKLGPIRRTGHPTGQLAAPLETDSVVGTLYNRPDGITRDTEAPHYLA